MNSPVFAVIGHPNEGKSSVVATLAENDRIRISPVPGETTVSTAYPVLLDGQPVITFVDTPGFQNPLQTRLTYVGLFYICYPENIYNNIDTL